MCVCVLCVWRWGGGGIAILSSLPSPPDGMGVSPALHLVFPLRTVQREESEIYGGGAVAETAGRRPRPPRGRRPLVSPSCRATEAIFLLLLFLPPSYSIRFFEDDADISSPDSSPPDRSVGFASFPSTEFAAPSPKNVLRGRGGAKYPSVRPAVR